MRQRLMTCCWGLAAWLLSASLAFAQQAPKEPSEQDARFLGYGGHQNLQTDSGSVGLTWIIFIVLSLLIVAVMMKNAKRSHLD